LTLDKMDLADARSAMVECLGIGRQN